MSQNLGIQLDGLPVIFSFGRFGSLLEELVWIGHV
jgi:hypothetical protein